PARDGCLERVDGPQLFPLYLVRGRPNKPLSIGETKAAGRPAIVPPLSRPRSTEQTSFHWRNEGGRACARPVPRRLATLGARTPQTIAHATGREIAAPRDFSRL